MKKVLAILLFLAALAFTCIGGYGLWLVKKTSQPATLSVDEYLQKRSAARWVRLTSCKLNLLESSYTQNTDGSIKDLYVPVYSINDPTPEKIDILLHVTDETTFQLLDAMHDLKDEAEILNYLAYHRERVFPHRDVEGLVRFAGEFPESQRDVLKKVASGLSKNFIVLDENKLPSAGPAGAFLGLGVLFGIFALLLLNSSKLKKT